MPSTFKTWLYFFENKNDLQLLIEFEPLIEILLLRTIRKFKGDIMILHVNAKTLANLLAHEGGNCPHAKAVKDAILLARDEALLLQPSNAVSNDRTTLNHHLKS